MSGILLVLGISLTMQTQSTEGDPAGDLPAHVERLVQRLDDPDRAIRDASEQALIQLGPQALTLLPPVDNTTPAEVKDRLTRVRRALEAAEAERAARPTQLTLQGEMSLDEFLEAVRAQTGNRVVDFRDRLGQPAEGPRLELNFEKTEFWQAFDQALDQAGLTVYNFAGEPRVLAVVAKANAERPRAGAASYQGPFRIEPTEIQATRDLRNPENEALRLRIEILWEPRLAPVLIRQPYDNIQLTTDQGTPLELTVQQGAAEIPVQSTVAGVELVLATPLPPRSVREITSLQGRFYALIPGREATFTFDQLADTQQAVQQKGGLTVMLDRVRKNRNLVEVRVRLQLNAEQASFQSHLDWASNNQAVLLGPDGQAIENPNFERYLERPQEIGFAYLFPTERELQELTFQYRTPAAIFEVPVDYELTGIPLP